MKEMLLVENIVKFKELRIELRKPANYFPYFGTINGEVANF